MDTIDQILFRIINENAKNPKAALLIEIATRSIGDKDYLASMFGLFTEIVVYTPGMIEELNRQVAHFRANKIII